MLSCGGGGGGDQSTGPAPSPVVTTGTITGKVTDASTSAAVAGASVSTQPGAGTATTDAQGTYTITNVAPGAYTVQATAATYATTGNSANANATVTAGQTATANLALAPLLYLDLTVNSATDLLNGDVTSTRTLFLSPGQDGISLREAIAAANNTPGAHTITFSDALVGQTIKLTQFGMRVTRDSVTITGRFGTDGAPAVTLDASTLLGGKGVIWVTANGFTLSRVRIVHVPYLSRAVIVTSGATPLDPGTPEVSDITIRDNVFDNRGHDYDASGVELRMEDPSNGARMRNITITHNVFRHFQGDRTCVQVGNSGAQNVHENEAISNNYFSECTNAVELVNGAIASNGRIVGTRIIGNYFENGPGQAIAVGNLGNVGGVATVSNVIDSTVILGNKIVHHDGHSIHIVGGGVTASGCAILNTQIVNNLITSNELAIGIVVDGGTAGGLHSRVQGITIANNTIVNNNPGAVLVSNNNGTGASGNSVQDLSLINNVMWNNTSDVWGDIAMGAVRYSLLNTYRFLGANGNVSADPLFADATNGDYHLRTGSPAIQAGTTVDAPTTDIECRPRTGKPDIGAFQFGSPAVCALPKPFW